MSEWVQHAACRECDTAFFFPGKHQPRQMAAAKAVCAICPVITECLREAIVMGEPHGVRGGMSAKERLGNRRRLLAENGWLRCEDCDAELPVPDDNKQLPRCCDACRAERRRRSHLESRLRCAS